jgi:hypothetical protein
MWAPPMLVPQSHVLAGSGPAGGKRKSTAWLVVCYRKAGRRQGMSDLHGKRRQIKEA